MYSVYQVIRFCFKLIKDHHKSTSALLIMGGAGLIMEHLFTYDGFDLLDFAGHEYYGLAMILIGFLLSMKWKQWDMLGLKKFRNWWR